MPYTLDVNDHTQPLDADQALTLGGEMRAVKNLAGGVAESLSAAYTLTKADNGKTYYHSEAPARTISLPSAAMAEPDIRVGSTFHFVNGPGAGILTFAKSGTPTILLSKDSSGGAMTTVALAANGYAQVKLVAADVWQLFGAGLTGTP